jgi:hypothetical protein
MIMKKSTMLGVVLSLAVLPAFAGSRTLSIDEVVELTGMEKQEVQLMLGAYSNNHLYRTSFDRVSREWSEKSQAAGLVLQQVRDASGQVVAARIVRSTRDS